MILVAPAAIDDQSAVEETVKPDARIDDRVPRVPRAIRSRGSGTPASNRTHRTTARPSWVPTPESDMIGGGGNDLDAGRCEVAAIHRVLDSAPGSAEAYRPSDPVGQRAGDAPARRGLGDQLDAGGLDHQPDAAELSRCLRSPAEQTEVEAAWSTDAKLSHEGVAARFGAVASGALKTYS